jgi:hypothetical protein
MIFGLRNYEFAAHEIPGRRFLAACPAKNLRRWEYAGKTLAGGSGLHDDETFVTRQSRVRFEDAGRTAAAKRSSQCKPEPLRRPLFAGMLR